MRFIDVLQNPDKKWRRKSWDTRWYVYIKYSHFYWECGKIFNTYHNDVFADDWEVYEEPKKVPPMKIVVSTSPLGLQEPAELCTLEQLAKALAPYIKKELGL